MKSNDNIFYAFALILKTYREFMNTKLSIHGLAPAEIAVLVYLVNNSDLETTANDIVKGRGLSKSHVSMSVNSLIKKGIIKSKTNTNDKRSILLNIRNWESPIILEINRANAEFKELCMKEIDDASMEVTKITLNRMLSNLEDWREL